MKMMFIYLFLMIVFCNCVGQGVQGLILTAEDLKTNTSFPTNGSNCKILIHEIPYRSYVQVKCADTRLNLSKDSIFGYLDRYGMIGRFYNQNIYSVINPKETILLYKRQVKSGNPKDFRTVDAYYFSVSASADILPLTLSAILNVFDNNEAFTDLIETHFRSDEDLLMYDKKHSKFKINRLLELSKKQLYEK